MRARQQCPAITIAHHLRANRTKADWSSFCLSSRWPLCAKRYWKKNRYWYGPEYKLLSFTRISIVYNGIIPIISSNCIFNYESKPSISVHISLRSFTKIAFLMANNLLWSDWRSMCVWHIVSIVNVVVKWIGNNWWLVISQVKQFSVKRFIFVVFLRIGK